jgi:hypothetical protein
MDDPLTLVLAISLLVIILMLYLASIFAIADPTLHNFTKLVPKSARDMSRLQRRLARAGHPQTSAAVYFSLTQIALTSTSGILALVILGSAEPLHWVYAALIAAAAYVTPAFWIDLKIQRRKTKP